MPAATIDQEIEALLNAHQRELLVYAARTLRSPQLAQDIVQDAYLKWLSARRDGDAIDHPRAWLYRVTHNLCLDHIRKNQRRENRLHDNPDLVTPAPLPAPDANLNAEDRVLLAESLLAQLSDREQEVVRLKIYGEQSYRDIAEVLSISSSNVGFILHTAMKKLARYARIQEAAP